MALSSGTLNTQLTNLMDKEAGGFVEFGENPLQVATKWADAINAYAASVIPLSTGASAAKAAFISALTPGVVPGGFIAALVTAFTAYAAALGAGMAPAFVAVPPPSPVAFTTIMALPLGTPVATIISTFVTIIDIWFKTGSATPSAGGSPVLWS